MLPDRDYGFYVNLADFSYQDPDGLDVSNEIMHCKHAGIDGNSYFRFMYVKEKSCQLTGNGSSFATPGCVFFGNEIVRIGNKIYLLYDTYDTPYVVLPTRRPEGFRTIKGRNAILVEERIFDGSPQEFFLYFVPGSQNLPLNSFPELLGTRKLWICNDSESSRFNIRSLNGIEHFTSLECLGVTPSSGYDNCGPRLKNIQGIEFCTNLKYLCIPHHHIQDFSFLQDLSLRRLYINTPYKRVGGVTEGHDDTPSYKRVGGVTKGHDDTPSYKRVGGVTKGHDDTPSVRRVGGVTEGHDDTSILSSAKLGGLKTSRLEKLMISIDQISFLIECNDLSSLRTVTIELLPGQIHAEYENLPERVLEDVKKHHPEISSLEIMLVKSGYFSVSIEYVLFNAS